MTIISVQVPDIIAVQFKTMCKSQMSTVSDKLRLYMETAVKNIDPAEIDEYAILEQKIAEKIRVEEEKSKAAIQKLQEEQDRKMKELQDKQAEILTIKEAKSIEQEATAAKAKEKDEKLKQALTRGWGRQVVRDFALGKHREGW